MYTVKYTYRGQREAKLETFDTYKAAKDFFWVASHRMQGVVRTELIIPQEETA